MKKLLKAIIPILLAGALLTGTTGCGNSGKTKLSVYNWGDYIDETVLDDFEEKYPDIDVKYETFPTNEDMYTKLKAGGVSYDVAFPSEYMITKMINEDMLEKLDLSNIPNFQYIDSKFKGLDYDPKNEYSIPYMWGTVGILYNTKTVKDTVDSWNILWDKKYKDQILMLDSQRDSIGITLKKLGYSLNTKKPDELEAAKNALIEQKPLVMAYAGDDVKDKMINEEAALAVVWSGDAVYCMEQNSNLAYAIPKEGSNLWFDGIVIPKGAKHKKEAELFINYLCDTEIALRNTNYIGYSTPHAEAKKKLDSETLNNPAAYPSDDVLKNCEVFTDLSSFLKEYDNIWTAVKAK